MKHTPPSLHDVWNALWELRERSPLVHSITNFVVTNVTANALLALGASPVMAHAPEEMEEIIGIASALVLNIGTLSNLDIPSMHMALETATARNIPVVIDPVGAGASRLRTATALALLEKSRNACLRGNASEILTLAGQSGKTKGVDSTVSAAAAVDAAKTLAIRYACTVSVSGEADLVTDGKRLCFIHGGSAIMPRVTGMGCSASAIAGAFAATGGTDRMLPLIAAMCVMAAAGADAARRTKGPGTFLPVLLDNLYLMDLPMLEKGAAVSYAPYDG